MIFNMVGSAAEAAPALPVFSYTGSYKLIDDGDGNWRIKLFTSGVLTLTSGVSSIDVFLVGGGGGTRPYSGGAGGGRTVTQKMMTIVPGQEYQITIGEGGAAINVHAGGQPGGTGGTTAAFGLSAAGGNGGVANNNSSDGVGGDGASGGGGYSAGKGGKDGADGTIGQLTLEDGSGVRNIAGGRGLDDTTREFWETGGDLYASGGDGCYADTWVQEDAAANTGNGAPGGCFNGGSGIVVIRNAR